MRDKPTTPPANELEATEKPEAHNLKRLPVSDRADDLRARLREIPLADRLAEIPDRISKMCSQGRPPRMSIPVQWNDDDWFITYTVKDALASLFPSIGEGEQK